MGCATALCVVCLNASGVRTLCIFRSKNEHSRVTKLECSRRISGIFLFVRFRSKRTVRVDLAVNRRPLRSVHNELRQNSISQLPLLKALVDHLLQDGVEELLHVLSSTKRLQEVKETHGSNVIPEYTVRPLTNPQKPTAHRPQSVFTKHIPLIDNL